MSTGVFLTLSEKCRAQYDSCLCKNSVHWSGFQIVFWAHLILPRDFLVVSGKNQEVYWGRILLFCARKGDGTESDVEIQGRDLSGWNFSVGRFGHTGSLGGGLDREIRAPGHFWRLKWSGTWKLLETVPL
ncbi:Hypothetical_protein [Hexamita inflata]|uniref:Hypothetical_protein n=1 Tax=Hexamita inflata TaxID=28002 RepID=A0AA86VC66_9EUKA|nr:Hypothetical protein HINF_LOCUS50193 [Hexamita inflata]